MDRRWTLLAGALAIALAAPQATAAVAAPSVSGPPSVRTLPSSDAGDALDRLRADAEGRLRVHRTTDGAVDFISSTNGRAMLDGDEGATPRRSAQDQLARYGEAFGIDGRFSRAVVQQTLDSSTGGSIVRADQVVDGVPVFGGQIVLSLDEDQGVVSVDPATTDATQVADAVVGEVQAQRSALAATARTHRVDVDQLIATGKGRRLYDPAIVHTSDTLGVRPVWEFEVTNGSEIRERVLVGTDRGEIALHFNDVPEINRVVCDNAGVRATSSYSSVPQCLAGAAARVEDGAPSDIDVNQAYDNLGATSDAYSQLNNIDLTELVGAAGTSGDKALMSTVRWCFSDTPCPYSNAFWDGTQMVFGSGFAAADDVVAHELTHGYVERTSGLFYFHQSGAINESVSDVIGEIVDHRNPASADLDSAWEIGEDLPGMGSLRSLADPPLHGQPDRMRSAAFVDADVDNDSGAVHDNNGVGNKTAYLISQGGTFNGEADIVGIDAGDVGLAKSGRLWLETVPRLTSGSEYADLGRVLVSTCAQLVASDTGGFTQADCGSVGSAVAATELSSAPLAAEAAAPEAPVACPEGNSVNTLLRRDDDGIDGFGFDSESPLWTRAPDASVPSYATSGKESLFLHDPNPAYGHPVSGSVTSTPFEVPGGTRLNFHHAHVLDWYGNTYYDGGQVVISKLVNGTWTTVSGLPWVNGPTRSIVGSTAGGFTGFGGDSRGYGSSEVDLSSLAGQTVRVSFQIEGDAEVAAYGWWIDDIRLYSCGDVAGAPTVTRNAAATTSATVSWNPPAYVGSGIASYKITRSDGKTATTVSSAARSATVTGFSPTAPLTVSVAAVNPEGQVGTGTTSRFYPTVTTASVSATRVRKGRYFSATGRVTRRGTSTVVAAMPVVLQRRMWGKTTWSGLRSGTTSSRGIKTWSVKHYSKASYRVVSRGVSISFGSTSSLRTVSTR